MIIDDIDTAIGEWEGSSGAANHQGIFSFLAHITNHPTTVEIPCSEDLEKRTIEVRRVPIFFTGNDESKRHLHLVGKGRTARFRWAPSKEETIAIVESILELPKNGGEIAQRLVNIFPNKNISFFSHLVSTSVVEALSRVNVNSALFAGLAAEDPEIGQQLAATVENTREHTDWPEAARQLAENVIRPGFGGGNVHPYGS
jgi:hypothetical protein